jgi:hypothetical protein
MRHEAAYSLKGVNMNTKKREDLLNEKTNPQVEEIADLPVTDEQARQSKGGSLSINFTKIEYKYTSYDDQH